MSKAPQFDMAALIASGAIQDSVGGSNVRGGSAISTPSSSGDGMSSAGSGDGPSVYSQQGLGESMLPVEGKNLEFPGAGGAGVGEVMQGIGGVDSMFAPFNEGGSAFGKSLAKELGESVDHLGAARAKGDNIALEQLGQGERQAPPTVQSDLQLKALSAKGNGGAASAA